MPVNAHTNKLSFNVLRQALKDFNHKYVEKRLRLKNIRWTFNPPTASNFDGIWESLFSSTRSILRKLLQ